MAPTMTVPPSPGRAMRSLAGGHVRSASVPCHSHPLLMHVDDQLLALRSWMSNPGQNPLSLAHVRALLCVLDELLRLPLAQTALLCGAASTDRLLDGFLVLADAYGSFLAALLALRQHASELQAAVRRRDPAKLASSTRAQRQVEKELAQLAAAVAREAARCARASVASWSSDYAASSELEVARTVAEAINDTAVASASVFLEVGSLADAAAAVATASSSKKRLAMVHASSRSKKATCEQQRDVVALAKLQELERCIGELESESEKVFRSLVQTRVSLLNIHTPTF